jgi:hypothetical protein
MDKLMRRKKASESSIRHQQIARLYEACNCRIAVPSDPLQAVIQLLDWAEREGPFLKAVVEVTNALLDIFRLRDKVTAEELQVARRVQESWGNITLHLPPRQPLAWSGEAGSSSDVLLPGHHAKFLLYIFCARERAAHRRYWSTARKIKSTALTQFSVIYEMPDETTLTDIYSESEDGSPEIVKTFALKYSATVSRAVTRIARPRRNRPPRARDVTLEMAFIHLRQMGYLETELRGYETALNTSAINFAANTLLSSVRSRGKRALAEGLSCLNEALMSYLPMTLGAHSPGERDPVLGGKTVAILTWMMQMEADVWHLAEDAPAELATRASISWLSERHDSAKSLHYFVQWLEWAGHALGTDGNLLMLWMLSRAPVAAITWLHAIAKVGFEDHEWPGGVKIEPEKAFRDACDDLLPYSGNPSRLPLNVRYRSIVRAVLLTKPPVESLVQHLIETGRIDLALEVAGTWWASVTPTVVSKSEAEGLTQWRDEIAKLTEGVMKDQEERGLLNEDHEEDDHWRHMAEILQRHGQQIRTIYNINEFWLSQLKSKVEEHLRYFSYEYDVPSKIFPAVRKGYKELLSKADRLHVDLLFSLVCAGGMVFLHRSIDRGSWEFRYVKCSRPVLIAGGHYTGRRTFGARLLSSELLGDELIAGLPPPDESAFSLARQIARLVVGELSLGSRVCVVNAPELSPFPMTAAFASELRSRNSASALAEFDTRTLWRKKSYNDQEMVINQYVGFVSTDQVADEIIWNDLGVIGTVSDEFSRPRLLEALAIPNSIVHVVSHGLLDERDPMLSLLATTDNHHLMPIDFSGKHFSASLLMLNSCSSAAGGAYGSGFGHSFTHEALDGGVRAVIGNVLPVDTRDAQDFSQIFQSYIINSASSAAEAFSVAVSAVDERGGQCPMTLVGRSLTALFAPAQITTPSDDGGS